MYFTLLLVTFVFFFSSRRRHTRSKRDWSSDVCSSDLTCVDVPTNAQVDLTRTVTIEFDANARGPWEIGRASCRERVEMSVGAGALKKKIVDAEGLAQQGK